MLVWRGSSLVSVTEGNQQAIHAFFAGLDEEAHDLAERLAHGDGESVWAWFERRYPRATKRAAKGRPGAMLSGQFASSTAMKPACNRAP
jgi:hypothetical protein